MARDYDTIHLIQDAMKDKDDKMISLFVRMYNRLHERKCYSSALSTSITLQLALKKLGYESLLILGTVAYQDVSYPHIWLEIDQKIYDLAIHLDTQHQPVLLNNDIKVEPPQINISYNDAKIDYYAFQFADTYIMSDLKRLVGKKYSEYINNAPQFDIINDVCYIMDIPETKEQADSIMDLAEQYTIKDGEETV
ncbi:MAG: hypothetical protein IJ419_13185 [Agathobacter sp.]|nr:hypothetical protein [Agathobacter sp.]